MPAPAAVATSTAGAVLALALALVSPPRVRALLLAAAALAAVLAAGALTSTPHSLPGRLLHLPAVALLAGALWRAWPELTDATGQARERARIAGQEQVRAQIARELHDDTLQQLATTRRRLLSAAQDADHRTQAAILASCELLAEQTTTLRAVITDLHPPALSRLGLVAAVEALLDRAHASRPEIHPVLHLDDPHHLGWPRRTELELELAVYRVIQEALSNALKHSGASTITVTLRRRPDHVVAVVADDGNGFDLNLDLDLDLDLETNRTGRDRAGTHRHFGLVSMRSRTEANNGTLDITTGPDGTTITAHLPLSATATA